MRKENQTNELELYREYKGQRGFSLDVGAMENGKFAYLENMYIDREGGGLLESVPGYRRLFGAEDKIHSLALQNVGEEKFIIFHSGKRLYKGQYPRHLCSFG